VPGDQVAGRLRRAGREGPMTGNKLQPALLGGLFIGVLSALPVVNLFNCCCLWIIAGGMLSAYLLQQSQPTVVQVADGALVGLLAGLFGGILGTVLSIPLDRMTNEYMRDLMGEIMERSEDVPADLRDMLENFAVGPTMLALKFFVSAVVGAIFGMLGGIIGAAVFKKGAPPSPPGTIDVPPPVR
jgi:hypothetical protein